VITNTVFTNNKAASRFSGSGGALFITGVKGTLSKWTVTASTFAFNEASVGGAIAGDVSAELNLDSVLVSSNVAVSGGGLSVLGTLNCINSIISGNSAQLQGGAIVAGLSSELYMTNYMCSNNTCRENGGCFYSSGTLLCDNCTVTGNEALFNGAAVYREYGISFGMTFSNSLITDNTAQQSGGAWFGAGSDQEDTIDILFRGPNQAFNNKAGCCYASGYGSKIQFVSANATCSDIDTGKDCSKSIQQTACLQLLLPLLYYRRTHMYYYTVVTTAIYDDKIIKQVLV
jgi:hypothetical protein